MPSRGASLESVLSRMVAMSRWDRGGRVSMGRVSAASEHGRLFLPTETAASFGCATQENDRLLPSMHTPSMDWMEKHAMASGMAAH
eukprot:6173153-Pleurochrysis_carterae.AAC.3